MAHPAPFRGNFILLQALNSGQEARGAQAPGEASWGTYSGAEPLSRAGQPSQVCATHCGWLCGEMNPHGTTGAPHCDPAGRLHKTSRPGTGPCSTSEGKRSAAGAPLAHARPEMPRPSVDSHDLPFPMPALMVAPPLHRPGQAAQLLQDTGAPSPSCGVTKVGAVWGFCIQEGKGWSSHKTLPWRLGGLEGGSTPPQSQGSGSQGPLGRHSGLQKLGWPRG